MISLRPRLKILYDRARILLDESAGFHDIACDHAKLAAAIASARPDVRIEASDILQSAIERARATTNLSTAELFVSDGFANHTLNEGDVVVIAGIGGHTIIDLLTDAVHQIGGARRRLQLLLQTNQQIEILRENLYHREDVQMMDEFLVRDRKQIYVNFHVEIQLPWLPVKATDEKSYEYYGGGPLLISDKIEADSLLEVYLLECLSFADMKIQAVTQECERANWRRHRERVLEILRRGQS